MTDPLDLRFKDITSVRIAVELKDGRTISKDYDPDALADIIGVAIEKELQKRGMSLAGADA